MKRHYLLTIVLGLLISQSALHSQVSYRVPEPITKVSNQITIGVLPQIELISIVQTISQYPTVFGFLMASDTSIYRTEVINYFNSYKSHPAVLMFERLSLQPRMLNFSAPSNIMLYTDEFLDLRTDIELDDFVIERAGGIDSLRLFIRLLRDFAVQTSFNDFFHAHRDFYLTITETTIKHLGSVNYISELENFYGKTQKSYNIILVALYKSVGFGNSIVYSDQTREIYNTLGPKQVTNYVPFFGDELSLKYMIRHEFSHPFINPLTEKYWDYIKDYSKNYDSVPEIARKNVCGDWQECVNEFIIRAITTHLAYNESLNIGAWAYNKELGRGISYLDILLDKIKVFESNRDKYPTFESFYPTLLDVFKNNDATLSLSSKL